MTGLTNAQTAPDASRQDLWDEMGRVRAEIDVLDDQLVALLARRQRQVERAAAVKARLGLPARVPDRIDEVLERVTEAARREELATDLAQALWRAIIEWAIAHEEKLMGDGPMKGDGDARDRA